MDLGQNPAERAAGLRPRKLALMVGDLAARGHLACSGATTADQYHVPLSGGDEVSEKRPSKQSEPHRRPQRQATPQTAEYDGLEPPASLPMGAPKGWPAHSTARSLRQSAVLRLQAVQGNAYVQRQQRQAPAEEPGVGPWPASATSDGQVVIQRHPEGAGLSVEPGTVTGELQGGGPAGGAQGTGETAAAPAEGAAETATPTAAGPAAEGEGGGTGEAAPAPVSSNAMDLTRAQQVLQDTFGDVHTIVPGNIVLLDDNAAIWAAYDRVARGRNNPYVTPNRPWQDGDAQAAFPHGLNGFQDAGTVYVSRQTSSPTTTCHEMLHLNTASGFRGSMGETINEGSTQYLTVKALTAAGVALPATIPYQQETDLVGDLVNLVGEDRLIQAYFNGGGNINALIGRVDLSQGEGTFAILRQLGDGREFDRARALLRPGGGTQQEHQPITDESTVTV